MIFFSMSAVTKPFIRNRLFSLGATCNFSDSLKYRIDRTYQFFMIKIYWEGFRLWIAIGIMKKKGEWCS